MPSGRPVFRNSGRFGTPAHPEYANSLVSGVVGSSKRWIWYQPAYGDASWRSRMSFHAQNVMPVWFHE